MSFYNTGNPVPSIDPRDLDDNAKILDGFTTSADPTFTDRLGVERQTLAGIISDNNSLATSLANSSDPSKGAALVGFRQPGAGSVPRTLYDIAKERVTVQQFGAVGDGIADDTSAIQAAINYAASIAPAARRGAWTVEFLPPSVGFRVTGSIFVPVNVRLNGNNSEIIPSGVIGSYTGGFIFLVNTVDAINWVVSFPNLDRGDIVGLSFNNSVNSLVGIRGICAASAMPIRQVRARKMYQTYKKVGGYIDSVSIHGVECQDSQGSDYQIELSTIGDGIDISQIHAAAPATSPLLKINSGGSGNIVNAINGVIELNLCGAITIRNWHNEEGRLILDRSNSKLCDSEMFRQGTVPIELRSTGNTFSRFTFEMEDIRFVEWLNSGAITKSLYDLKVHDQYTVKIRNCARHATFSGANGHSYLTGMLVQKSDNSPLVDFNAYSHVYSHGSRVRTGQTMEPFGWAEMSPSTSTWFGLADVQPNSPVISPAFTWKIASSTYFYRLAIIYDALRGLGVNDSQPEDSTALTNGGSGCLISITGLSGARGNAMLRVYRGTVAGSYSSYVDIPLLAAKDFYDDGSVCNGYPWLSRAAGPRDTLNLGVSSMEILDSGSLKIRGTAAPTTGAWLQGDSVIFTNPVAGGFIGAVCTTAGSPGTWKTFGAITA